VPTRLTLLTAVAKQLQSRRSGGSRAFSFLRGKGVELAVEAPSIVLTGMKIAAPFSGLAVTQGWSRSNYPVILTKEGREVRTATYLAARDAGLKGNSLSNFLATVEAESGFQLVSESHKYQVRRARETFSTLASYSDAEILQLVKGVSDNFFEAVYGAHTAVGKRLGNVRAGDGSSFRGRGLIQLTGRDNYQSYSNSGMFDVVHEPELLNEQRVAIDAALWFWRTKVVRMGAEGDIRSASRVVNPYMKDYGTRIAAADKYRKVLELMA